MAKRSRRADVGGWAGHREGNWALRVCEPPGGECAVQRQILSPGGYQGEGISVPRMRAEMGSPWSVSFFDTLKKIPQTKLRDFLYDPYGNRTHVTAVKGPCLNRLTNGP